MKRRDVLKLLGAGAIAAPVAGHLLNAGSRGAGTLKAQDEEAPTRFIVMYTSNGTVWPEWFPRGGDSDFELGRILQPLESFRDRLVIPMASDLGTDGDRWREERGISIKCNDELPSSGHGIGWLLTGAPVRSFGDQDWASGPSVDQLIADSIAGDTPYRSLELGVRVAGEAGDGQRLSYRAAGEPLPAENDADAVWERLFGDYMDEPVDPMIEARALARRNALLNFAEDGLGAIGGAHPAADNELVRAHLEALAEVRGRGGSRPASDACIIPPKPNVPDHESWDDYSTMPAVARAQIDNLVGAFGCDMTRVATLQITEAASNARHPFLMGPDGAPITDWHHTLSHASPEDTTEMEKLISIGVWHAQQFAYLLQSLQARTDFDGRTLLDNTVILWAQELSEARFHTHQNMPFLLAGGGNLNTGRVVRVPDSTHNDLLLSCMHACGVDAEAVGDPALCSGGVAGLLT